MLKGKQVIKQQKKSQIQLFFIDYQVEGGPGRTKPVLELIGLTDKPVF